MAPDGLEFAGMALAHMAFTIDAFDREIISFTGVSGAGASSSDVRDMMVRKSAPGIAGAPFPGPVQEARSVACTWMDHAPPVPTFLKFRMMSFQTS